MFDCKYNGSNNVVTKKLLQVIDDIIYIRLDSV